MDGLDLSTQHRRLSFLAGVLLVAALALAVRVARWQVLPLGQDMPDAVPDVMYAARGSVLDATGHALVVSTLEYDLGISPNILSASQRETLPGVLAAILQAGEA